MSGRRDPEEAAGERTRLAARAEGARAAGRSIVVVQGLGFVGSAMAAVVADATDDHGLARFHVIGVDRADEAGLEKVAALNRGEAVVEAEDPELSRLTHRAALDTGNLEATVLLDAYALADVVVVDLPLHAGLENAGDRIEVDLEPFRSALHPVAQRVPPETLILIETTVPPGTTQEVVLPLFQAEFKKRGIRTPPLVAHSYERVMPGPRYVQSIRSFWRCYAGSTPEASRRARAFLSAIIDTEQFPLTELSSTTASEVAKVLENSYRAANIAFIEEWSKAAEAVGVNLFEVVAAIRKRKGTHDNIRQPGFGVGGYCLPKDGFLAEWGLEHLLGYSGGLELTRQALLRNREMPLHAAGLLEGALPTGLRGATIGLAGVSYLASVGDTRNSPAEVFTDAVLQRGGRVLACDPLVKSWEERPSIPILPFDEVIAKSEAVVLAVPHPVWREITPRRFGSPKVILDAVGLLSDDVASALRDGGHQVIGVGRGDWQAERKR